MNGCSALIDLGHVSRRRRFAPKPRLHGSQVMTDLPARRESCFASASPVPWRASCPVVLPWTVQGRWRSWKLRQSPGSGPTVQRTASERRVRISSAGSIPKAVGIRRPRSACRAERPFQCIFHRNGRFRQDFIFRCSERPHRADRDRKTAPRHGILLPHRGDNQANTEAEEMDNEGRVIPQR